MSAAEPILSDIDVPVTPPQPISGERFARLQLARSQNVGPRTFSQLLRRYGSAQSAMAALSGSGRKRRQGGLCRMRSRTGGGRDRGGSCHGRRL